MGKLEGGWRDGGKKDNFDMYPPVCLEPGVAFLLCAPTSTDRGRSRRRMLPSWRSRLGGDGDHCDPLLLPAPPLLLPAPPPLPPALGHQVQTLARGGRLAQGGTALLALGEVYGVTKR